MRSLVQCISRGFLFTMILSVVVITWAADVKNHAFAQTQDTRYEGYVADVLCATRGTALDGADMLNHPEKHTVGWLKEPPCVASGFGILTTTKDETYTFHKFDKKGNELALELIKKTKKRDHSLVVVTGQMKDGVINVDSIVEK
ncbi:MAG: hypothetical protein ACLPVO_06755 [Desulfomonilaceae bacterium]